MKLDEELLRRCGADQDVWHALDHLAERSEAAGLTLREWIERVAVTDRDNAAGLAAPSTSTAGVRRAW